MAAIPGIILSGNEVPTVTAIQTGSTLNARLKEIMQPFSFTRSLSPPAPGTRTRNIAEKMQLPVYIWFESNNVEWYSPATTVYMPVDMSTMFKDTLLQNIDFSGFDLSQITNMSQAFSNSSLIQIDLSGRDTSQVVKCSGLFQNCNYLTSVGLSNIKLDNANSTENSMFLQCSNLSSVNLTDLDLSTTYNFDSMFNGCQNLSSIDLSSVNVNKYSSCHSMFNHCSKLTSIVLPSPAFDSEAVRLQGMFSECTNLTSVDLSKIKSRAESVNTMFYGCQSLKFINVSNIIFNSNTTYENVFYNCNPERIICANDDLTYNRWIAILNRDNASSIVTRAG